MKREYLFIDDAVDAYIKLMESIDPEDKGKDSKVDRTPAEGHLAYSWCAYNVGGGRSNVKTVEEVVDAILEIMNAPKQFKVIKGSGRFNEARSGYFELPNQYTSSVKIREEIGWKPKTQLIPTGLAKSVEWYQDNFSSFESLARAYFARCESRG